MANLSSPASLATVPGLLVAVRSEQSPETRQQFVAARVSFAITAVVQFSGRRCEIEFIDPLAVETVNVLGRSLPSAADFTAPLALGLSRERPERLGLRAMLVPEKFAEKARLTRLQPYDPKRFPSSSFTVSRTQWPPGRQW